MGKWWWACLVFVLTVVTVVAFIPQLRRHPDIVAIGALSALLVGSFVAYHRLRTAPASPSSPPSIHIEHVEHFHTGGVGRVASTSDLFTASYPYLDLTPPGWPGYASPPNPDQGVLPFDQDEEDL